MNDAYMNAKAAQHAGILCSQHKVGFQTALKLTTALWDEARRAILAVAGSSGWNRLSFAEKACICQAVIKGLLDKKTLNGFLSGERKGIL